MKILAIDTSSEVCGVALLEDDKLIDDNSLKNGKTHSENLMLLIEEILKRNKLTLNDINLIACTVGPGSFTGIRIGVASIKAISEVNNIELAEITSLEVLAQNIDNFNTKVALIDARNDQVYCGIFDENSKLKENYIADSIEVAIEKMKKYTNISVSGSGAEKYKELLKKEIPNINFSDNNEQSAEKAGIIGYRKYKENNLKSADEIIPIYLRKSQAERLKRN